MGQIKNIMDKNHASFSDYVSSNIIICLFFHLTNFRELGQKYKNIFVRFLVQMKTLKFAFETNWPLALNLRVGKYEREFQTSENKIGF